MPYFRIKYKIKNQQKSIIINANNKIEAIELFMKNPKGSLINITKISKPLSMYWKELDEKIQNINIGGSGKVKIEPYIASLRQIGIMLDAGMPINFALAETIDFTKDRQLKKIFSSILRDIESGKSLTDSAKVFKKQIGELSISMFFLGEQTGTLSESILKLADILDQIETNRRMLKKATRYPLFIIFAMIIAFGIVITMVIPQFQELFIEAKVELPFPTRLLLWIEGATVKFGPYIIGGALTLTLLYGYIYKKSMKVRLYTDKFMLKIYIVGDVIRYAMIGRFIYVLHTLLEAGIPIIQAIQTSISVVENRWIKYRLEKIIQAINEGHSLYEGFEDSNMFERIIIQMIKTGEDGGALGTMLDKASKYYADRYQYIVDNIAILIEPILISAIAGFVLILALGIFLPMWNMVSVMS